MATINCYIPLKLQLRGELSEEEWAALEDRLVTFYASTIERSLKELAKSHLIEREKPSADDSGLLFTAEQFYK